MSAISIPFRGLCCGFGAMVLSPTAFAGGGASFQGLGDLPGGVFYSMARGVSADGLVVVGSSQSGSGGEAFRWTSAAGMVGLGDLPGGGFSSTATGATADGSMVVGNSQSAAGAEAFLWTQGGGMSALGDLPGDQYFSHTDGCSGDGSVVVGWSSSSNGIEAFRWTQADGMVGLGDFSGGIFLSAALDANHDGSVIVGYGRPGSGEEAFRWTSDSGMIGLGDLSGGAAVSIANAVTADGEVIVGRAESGSGTEAFRWTDGGGMVGLGDLAGGTYWSIANDVSDDGSVIVGEATTGAGTRAFIWDQSNGMRELSDVLMSEYGLDLTGWTLIRAHGISADGLTIVGEGTNPDGNPEGWIAILDAGTSATVNSFTVQTGTHISGSVGRLRNSDNRFVKIESEFIQGGNPPYEMILEVQLTSDVIDPESLHILIEQKLTQNGGKTKLYLRDWAQGGWTLISTDPIGKTEMTQKVGGLNPARYISASGIIKLRIKHTKTTSSNGDPFRSLIDHIQALVR